MDTGHWKFDKDFDPDEWFGFIYRIVDLTTGREYIGKKQFHSYTRKVIKGRKNRKKVTKESNWKEYTGSSTELNEQIELKGKESFDFFIESLHKTKGSLYYAEVEKHIKENVLRERMENGERKYYNKQTGSVKFLPPLPTLEEEQMRRL